MLYIEVGNRDEVRRPIRSSRIWRELDPKNCSPFKYEHFESGPFSLKTIHTDPFYIHLKKHKKYIIVHGPIRSPEIMEDFLPKKL